MAGPQIVGTQPDKPIPGEFAEIEHVDDAGTVDITGTARVKRTALGHWEARGWREVPDAPADTPAAEPAAAQPTGDAAAKPAAPRRSAPTGQES